MILLRKRSSGTVALQPAQLATMDRRNRSKRVQKVGKVAHAGQERREVEVGGKQQGE